MTKQKKSRRSQRGGGWFGPDDPYAPKKSWMDSLSGWWSGTSSTGSTGTGLLSTAENKLSNFATNISNSTSQALNTISSPSTYQSSNSSSYSSYPNSSSYSSPAPSNSTNNNNLVETYGGKGRRRTLKKKAHMKGGKGLGLTYYATPVSGLKVAEPTTFLKYGGKRHKSRRHKKH
jgi:hypothetical protein